MRRGSDVLILGAGAAGLFCAFNAALRGRTVRVLERANKVGKKILMSGGGRCNFTNLYIEPGRYLSANPHFCKSALSRYTQWDFIELVDRHNIAWHDKGEGQLFCDESSKDIVAMLLAECEAAGVEIELRCETTSVEHDGADFTLDTSHGTFKAPALVVATGGLSVPSLGGSGFGYELAEQFGHSALPRRAGLVPFTFSDSVGEMAKRLAGVSVGATLTSAGACFDDQVLFTHRGLSGPAVLQLSSYWREGEPIEANLLPGAVERLIEAKRLRPRVTLRGFLSEHLPRKLVGELEVAWWPGRTRALLADWPDRELVELGHRLGAWRLLPSGTEGYRTAEVTLGGVDTHRVSSQTFESRTHPGLFLLGEVLDVTGHLGGFNFQWAWSSGWCAAEAI